MSKPRPKKNSPVAVYGRLAGKSWALIRNGAARSEWTVQIVVRRTEMQNRVSEVRVIPQRVLGDCWNFHDMAEAVSRLEQLVEVMAGAVSGGASLSCIATRVA